MLILAMLVILAGACSGGGESNASPPRLVSAQARRDVVQGIARQSTTIDVRFDRSFTLVSSRLPLASYFELEVTDPRKSTPERVFVKAAVEPKDSSRAVTLTVDHLVPDGSLLKVARKAFAKGASGDLELPIESDLSELEVILATTPLRFANPALFAEPTIAPVTDSDRDAPAMRKVLEQHFDTRRSPDEFKNAGLALYDQIPVETVPSPKARAALAALTGTFAQDAIPSLLGNNNCTGKPAASIAFQPPPQFPDLLGRATLNRDGRRVISLNPKLEGERIEAIMTILAHEAIHCDERASRNEEVAAISFDTLLYLELISAFHDLPASGTLLVRELNINALAMINSGARHPESVGILRSAGFSSAVPGSTSTVASFGDLVVAPYTGLPDADSPDEPVARAYVAALASRSNFTVKGAFDLRFLDELLGRSMDIRVLTAAFDALGVEPEG
jgi:hypothetical protein